MIDLLAAQAEKDPRLQGKRPLRPEDFAIYEHFGFDYGCHTFCLDVLADEETLFGRQLSSEQEDSYIVVYALYDEATGQVEDALDIELRWPHGEIWFCCDLSPEMRTSLKKAMDDFCLERYGERLPEPPKQSQAVSDAPQTGPVM